MSFPRIHTPFALGTSKGSPELVEGLRTSLRSAEGVDKLSPNGTFLGGEA